jgi:lipoprotein-releasing system permease protein
MSIISVVGIALAVFALIATLAVRSGFRHEFVKTILGANAHVTLYATAIRNEAGRLDRSIRGFEEMAARVAAAPGVLRAAPAIRGQVMISANGYNSGVEVFGERIEDLRNLPLIAHPETAIGSLERLDEGIAIGTGVARDLGVTVGDRVKLISPDGVKTAFGTAPRVKSYKVVYIFGVGRYDIDRVRVYLPFAEAQAYFNREGTADEIEILVADPDRVEDFTAPIIRAAGPGVYVWTWWDASGAYLQALQMEDNVMFVILAILVLIAAMNIVSGLIMLVKNKGRDVGILRTMGLAEGSILRVFFLVGALVGLVGTAIGVVLGCLFAIYIDPVFDFVNWVMGGGVWDPSIRFLSKLPARLELGDVVTAVVLSLGLSFVATIFPARRAARLNPVEALRYE